MNNRVFSNSYGNWYDRIPIALRTIIGLTVAVYLVQIVGRLLGGRSFENFITYWFAFYPDLFVTVTEPWRLVTYLFLHAGILHILFNMLILYWIGRSVEERLGPLTFCAIYFGAGIGGALLDIALAQFFGIAFVIGASGAIFGIMVAFAMLFPRAPVMLFPFPFTIEARYLIAGLIALQVLLLGSGGHVARLVHLGGAGVGYLLMKLWQNGYDISRPMHFMRNGWYRLKNSNFKPKGSANSNMYSVTDVEVIEEDNHESELDEILEKISKEGYDALSKREKKRLFELSNKN